MLELNHIDFATLALVVFTAILALATIMLARHTKSLAKLTQQLVQIEELRERRQSIEKAFWLAEKIQHLKVDVFIGLLAKGIISQDAVLIKEIIKYKKYLNEHDPGTGGCFDYASELTTVIENVERGSNIGSNGPEIERKLKHLQDRLFSRCIPKWREEFGS